MTVQARMVYGPQLRFGQVAVLAWSVRSLNCTFRENTCFNCYIIPHLWL